MSFGVYSLEKAVVLLGALELKDMPADSFITITPMEKAFDVLKGAKGGMTRYETGNKHYQVKLRFKKSSKENIKLSLWLAADATKGAAGTGIGVTTFTYKDGTGETSLVSTAAWIAGPPETVMKKDVGDDVEWLLDMQVEPGAYIVGGNQI